MSSVLPEITPALAWLIIYEPSSAPAAAFFAQHGRGHGDEFYERILDLAEQCDADREAAEREAARNQQQHAWPRATGARPPGYRRDAAELTAFVTRSGRLPQRELQVHELCIARGLSLGACANALGITRETVRTHLRNLRAKMRRAH
jgi:DNA-binding CsgD family transcriptional regulator